MHHQSNSTTTADFQMATTGYLKLIRLLTAFLTFSITDALQNDQNGKEASDFPFTSDGQMYPWNKMRLPKTIVPVQYDLVIQPNLTTLNFSSSVRIEVLVESDTNSIILHSKNLEIIKATVIPLKKDGTPGLESNLEILEYPPFEQLALQAEAPLHSGNTYLINIDYIANLSESFHGFYKSTFKKQDGEISVLAATQFEPTAARMAFPCFDEPAFKAKFSIKIQRESRHIAVSNMPIINSVELANGLIEDQFDVSVKMSTYLVAFIVADFKSVSKETKHGVNISVYSVPEKINQTSFALDAAVRLLEFYEDYFNISYPLPKQDLAAIPDFQSGAMENWGLTTYRESALLYNAATSSASDKLGITMIIAHELAHQWFGNLVTMEWWNDLWLNEGFAKFMEIISVNITYPELQVREFFLDKCFSAMEVDSFNSSHPVSTPVEHPAQIQEMFDDVSYEKGACILSMLMDYLTEDVFKAGIIHYLRCYSYGNAKNEDLWNSLTNICPSDDTHGSRLSEQQFCLGKPELSPGSQWFMKDVLDVKEMMNTWTLQKGFPLVTVTVKGRQVLLRQELYQKGSNSQDENSESSSYLWQIPLTYITSHSKTVQRHLMRTKNDVITLLEEVNWIKFNVDMNGYYIVHYEKDGWDALIKLLRESHTVLSSNDRASLINNAFQLVSIGKLPLDKALDLTLYLKNEVSTMPVFQGMNELIPIYKLMEKREMEEVENQMKMYIVNLFKNLIDQQSWSDDGSVSERLLRSTLLVFACIRKYQPCVDKAEEYFRKWMDSNGTLSLPTDVALAIFAVGVQTTEGWDFLFEKYKHSPFTSEKSKIRAALTISKNTEKLQWLMDQSLQDDIIKTQDLPSIVTLVSRNPTGYRLAWEFFKKNWNKLIEKFELGSPSIAYIVAGITSQYSTRLHLEEVRGFFESLKDKGSQLRCVQQAIETIEENIQWMDKNFIKIATWLENLKSLD
ncbi:endoplasmic reticulum aminopeptidase 1b [Stegostoma tigrinum]|uniref:endoplasmic reticulum aminopeptidase 1b n=1 Tax=Stegostoma tigrinum TaxID=3053191 RepID=UPI00202AD3BB|nr:endoplasmic reticulum aminopeptidase 1b [Stegostoma tigrinum]XP_048382849.1 endoplasmic reticulum aminopeptidase 1b [Stegostoma tigrinum]XP_048382850.1 endoplasmic reticulum aminopeptidase 1b [Stegostoma tigrinum]XP_048382851.1 endoplasmic reticulum aminopeptidase 1b [Stegostoma tigrinum]